MWYSSVATVLVLPLVASLSVSRRDVLSTGVLVAGAGSSAFLRPEPSNAARGAAELDFEYYMRDLVGGNKKEGSVMPSNPPTTLPPRTLAGPLLPIILNDSCSTDCAAGRALAEQVLESSTKFSKIQDVEREIISSVQSYRDKAGRSFYTRSPWEKETVSDQYFFDLTSYALWRTAADLLPANYLARDAFMRRLGRLILERTQRAGLVSKPDQFSFGSLVQSTTYISQLLNCFVDLGYCRSFQLGEKQKSKEDQLPIFDDIDDEALQGGASIDALISLYEPATLGSSLQITGEQSRFLPDFVGPTLAAIWTQYAGIRKTTWEIFFVDPEYRPNPKDYFPNEQLFQYTLQL